MIFTIAGKELRSMFTSPLAWVVLAFLQFVLALIFLKQIDGFMMVQAQQASRLITYKQRSPVSHAIRPLYGALRS